MKCISAAILIILLLLSSCTTVDSGRNGNEIIGLSDTTFLNAPLDSKKLRSREDYLAALEDNEALIIEWDDSMQDDFERQAFFHIQNQYFKLRKVKLIGDLSKEYPDSPELKELLLERFDLNEIIYQLDIRPEVEAYAEKYSDSPEEIEKAWYYYYDGLISRNYRKDQPVLAALSAFELDFPESSFTEPLYRKALSYLRETPAEESLTKLILQRFPSERDKADEARKKMAGKEFRLSFNDAVTGKHIDLDEWKGRIVVVDFWATWCSPCVGEIPEMLRIYSEYKNLGVEFIGISLDRDREALKSFCRKNEVPWPQYYENASSASKISDDWHVYSIPTIFILDRQGKVYSVDARFNIERLINELL